MNISKNGQNKNYRWTQSMENGETKPIKIIRKQMNNDDCKLNIVDFQQRAPRMKKNTCCDEMNDEMELKLYEWTLNEWNGGWMVNGDENERWELIHLFLFLWCLNLKFTKGTLSSPLASLKSTKVCTWLYSYIFVSFHSRFNGNIENIGEIFI